MNQEKSWQENYKDQNTYQNLREDIKQIQQLEKTKAQNLAQSESLLYLWEKAQNLGFSLNDIDFEKIKREEALEIKAEQEIQKQQFTLHLFKKSGFDERFLETLSKVRQEFVLDLNVNTFLTGSFGSGKTVGVLKTVYDALKNAPLTDLKNYRFRYLTCYNLFNLRYLNLAGYEELKSVPLLILDEFMTLKNYQRDDFNALMHDLLDTRLLKNISTVLISNIKFEVIKELTKKGVVEPALFSRLKLFNKMTHLGQDKREKGA